MEHSKSPNISFKTYPDGKLQSKIKGNNKSTKISFGQKETNMNKWKKELEKEKNQLK